MALSDSQLKELNATISPRSEAPEAVPLEGPMREISTHVAHVYRIEPALIFSRRRDQHTAFARQVAMYVCRRITLASWPIIGSVFGRNDSVVIWGFNKIAKRVSESPEFARKMDDLIHELRGVMGPMW